MAGVFLRSGRMAEVPAGFARDSCSVLIMPWSQAPRRRRTRRALGERSDHPSRSDGGG